ncbi:hypothetical protein [Cesiribacter sp. SM1]|uniref:hypothetical protein n=1 Tax=Cesiribacter sp. SM1 TaxID=2861196 RepID=UPI001CD71870|nr:hypothetical protein [Cesiribacter sp. SM1]
MPLTWFEAFLRVPVNCQIYQLLYLPNYSMPASAALLLSLPLLGQTAGIWA